MPLCTQADLEALRQIDVTAEPDSVIATLISLAEGELEGLTGRRFDPVTDEEVVIEDLPEADGVVYLPHYPIIALEIEDSSTIYEAGTHYHLDGKGRVYRLGAGTGVYTWDWQFNVPTVAVPWFSGTTFTVTGGVADPDDAPRDLRFLCASIAALLYDRGTVPGGIQNESLGGWQAGYRLVSTDLSNQQMSTVRKYRHSMPVIAY